MPLDSERLLYTIGHSNSSIESFIDALLANDIECLVDVRKMPASRANPQFNSANLKESLDKFSIVYLHAPGLTGLRSAIKNSNNQAWRNKSFRAYADYMQTSEFNENLEILFGVALSERTVIMCAEVLPWRCHRSLIADAAVARDWEVLDIFSAKSLSNHSLRDFAVIDKGKVFYPKPSRTD